MKFCPQCGAPAEGKFCASCGFALTLEESPPVGTEVSPESALAQQPAEDSSPTAPEVGERPKYEERLNPNVDKSSVVRSEAASGSAPSSNRKLHIAIGVLTIALLVAIGTLFALSGNDGDVDETEDITAAMAASNLGSENFDDANDADETTTTTTSTSTTTTTTTTTQPPSPVLLEPPGLFCRDLKALGYSYAEAVEYWEHHGRTEQMDASGTGIPCQTVYPRSDVQAEWGVERLWPPCPSISELETAAFRLASEYEPGISPFPLTNARCVGTWAVAETPLYYFPEVHPHFFKLDANGTPTAVTYGTGVYCEDLEMIPQDPAYGIICS